jgi:uncharacterized membrane protein YedE/YeeE
MQALVGGGLGFVLFQSNFGFAGSFRTAIELRQFDGFRAQALSLALTSIVFFPLLAHGQLFGQQLTGFVTPIGVSFVLGALLFGIGMQIGGGCASGTLFALGGGNLRLLITLTFFVAGSAIGAAHIGFWRSLPVLQTGTSQSLFGWPAALAVHLAIFTAAIRLLPGSTVSGKSASQTYERAWTLTQGAFGLAALNIATLLLSGQPWGETAGFTLWGSKFAQMIGFEPRTWPYWLGNEVPLDESVFSDATSVMDLAIVAGATLAAGRRSRFVLRLEGRWTAWTGAAIGGLLMGYGARLSDGCNIGAYFSAVASGSLSGWIWIVGALAGSAIGLRLRRTLDPILIGHKAL